MTRFECEDCGMQHFNSRTVVSSHRPTEVYIVPECPNCDLEDGESV